jgi:hypothetical protein
MNQQILRTLTDAELDAVSGGADPNFKECVLGTTAGGGAGLYPNYVECLDHPNPLIDAFLKGVEKGKGKPA